MAARLSAVEQRANVEHLDSVALEAGLAHIRASPAREGTVQLIVGRPRDGERQVVDRVELGVGLGMVGDNWSTRPNRHTPDGQPDPKAEVTVMNARAAALLAQSADRRALAGDQLYVDFDVSEQNTPAGTQLIIGSAVLEVTDKPHNGCAKFRRHFGEDAFHFVNSPVGKQLHLRGINTRVVRAGVVRRGDPVRKL